jgi:hypothetical protein
MRAATLHAVSKLITMDNQVSPVGYWHWKYNLHTYSPSHSQIIWPFVILLSQWDQDRPLLTFRVCMMCWCTFTTNLLSTWTS